MVSENSAELVKYLTMDFLCGQQDKLSYEFGTKVFDLLCRIFDAVKMLGVFHFFVCLFLYIADVNTVCSFGSLYTCIFYYIEGIKDL